MLPSSRWRWLLGDSDTCWDFNWEVWWVRKNIGAKINSTKLFFYFCRRWNTIRQVLVVSQVYLTIILANKFEICWHFSCKIDMISPTFIFRITFPCWIALTLTTFRTICSNNALNIVRETIIFIYITFDCPWRNFIYPGEWLLFRN